MRNCLILVALMLDQPGRCLMPNPLGTRLVPSFVCLGMKGPVSRREFLVDFAMHATSVSAENPTAKLTIGLSKVGTGKFSQTYSQNTNNDVNNLLSLIPSSFFTLNLVKVNFSPRVSLANSLSMWTI